jgi:hypothetical protein
MMACTRSIPKAKDAATRHFMQVIEFSFECDKCVLLGFAGEGFRAGAMYIPGSTTTCVGVDYFTEISSMPCHKISNTDILHSIGNVFDINIDYLSAIYICSPIEQPLPCCARNPLKPYRKYRK